MTVAELIAKLRLVDQDMPVNIYVCDMPCTETPTLDHVLVTSGDQGPALALCEDGAHHFVGAYVVTD